MDNKDRKRIERMTAILTQLQAKRLLTAPELAARYSVSIRTIYRDIKSLELAGVPIVTEEGIGYKLMDTYRIPPVMFTENEANALIAAEQLVLKNKDGSLVENYSAAIDKIKAVLAHNVKDKANLLTERTQTKQIRQVERTSDSLSSFQFAITNFRVTRIEYINEGAKISDRLIEPFALLSTENWLLVAWCRLRKTFRYFRLDRIKNLEVLPEKFAPHNMTLQDFFDKYHVAK